MNLSSNFNRLSFNKLPLLKQPEQAEVKPEEELVVVQKQPTKIPRAEKITASALDAEALQNLTFVSTATTLDSNKLVGGVKHLTEAEAKEQGYTIINTAEDLVKLSNGELKGTKFILMNDIDMSNVKDWKGIYLSKAEFNGNGCTISNLSGTALFSDAYNSTIKNVNIENADITKGAGRLGSCAVLVAYAEGNLTLDNCNVKNSKIDSNSCNAGALIGSVDAWGLDKEGIITINNCNVTSTTVHGSGKVGGFIGESHNEVIITNGSFAGSVTEGNENKYSHTQFGDSVGGLIGQHVGNLTVKDTSVDVEVQGTMFSGGLVGELNCPEHVANIENISGNIKVTGKEETGGLFGCAYVGTNGQVKITGNLNVEMYDRNGELLSDLTDYPKYNLASGPAHNPGIIASGFGNNRGYGLPYVDRQGFTIKSDYVDEHFDTSGLTITTPNRGETEEIQYKYPDLIDMKQDEKDMKDAAYKQGMTESPCSGVYSKQVRSGNGYKTVYYIWNSNDKEFERCNDIKSINADGSYVNNRGKTINKPANEQIAARVGGYTPTVEEGTYFKDGKYYNYDEDSNEFFEVDKSLYEVHDEETTNTNGTKAEDTKTEDTKTDDTKADGTKSDGSSTIKKPENRKFIEVDFDGTLTPYNPNSRLIKVKLPYDFPLYKRFNK